MFSDAPALAGAAARRLVFELDPVAGYSGYMGKAYVDDFVSAIRENRSPVIEGDSALDVLRVVEAIYASDRENTWIEVNR